ncbi:MAG: SLBB domain-containing protein, partial [Pseudomonadota bacterium]
MPEISRQQLIVWSAVALVILLIGANYLRGQVGGGASEAASVVTVGLKEESARTTRSPLKIHVVGAVAIPGLYELETGARIADALAAAGGATPTADLSLINLAQKLADGQQV